MQFKTALIVSVKKAKHKRLFVLQADLICIDSKDRIWIVPKGFPTDFASIPSFALPFIEKAHQNAYAAVLHDYLYFTQPVSRLEADLLFREALASPDCNTPPSKQWIMYKAVRLGGFNAWSKIKQAMEATEMADQNIIDEEDEKNAFFEWIKRWWNRADKELDELEDDVRARAVRLFRQANWPGVRDREALYRKKAKKSFAFKIAYALVFLSSCITLYYWWGAMPDVTSKLLIGLGFFGANLLMPLWARMTFWQGGTWLQVVVNFFGLAILLSVSAASIVASAGLQGTKSDEVRTLREQQSIQYKTQLERIKQRNNRLAELRKETTRTASEIEAELKGLLVTEPAPQSGCQSRENFGAWSKRNCATVAKLRVEISQAKERSRLERESKIQTFDNTTPVTSVDPQYEIASRYLDVDSKTFNNAKPLILAILLEMIFNGLTLLLTITIGAEVREEIRERIENQRRALIGQAEMEVEAKRAPPPEPDPEPEQVFDAPPPVSPAPAAVYTPPKEPEVKADTKPAAVAIHTAPPVMSYEPEPEEEPKSLADYIPDQLIKKPVEIIQTTIAPAETVIEEKPAEPTELTETVEQEPELLVAKTEETDDVATESERNNELQTEILNLRMKNLVNDRSTAANIKLAARYALDRVKRQIGSRVKVETVWKDYAAWCSITGNEANDSVADMRDLLTSGLSLEVETIEGSEFVMNTVLKS